MRWVTIVALFACGGGVALGALLFPPQAPDAVTETVQTYEVQPVARSYDDARNEAVTLAVQPDQDVFGAAVTGVITDVNCRLGQPIASGEVLYRVGNSPVVGLTTKVPFWRDFSAGVKGVDVESLQEELERLGYSVSKSAVVDSQTRKAVGELQVASGMKRTGVLKLESIVWVPQGSEPVNACHLVPGALVSAGDKVVTLQGALSSVTVPPAGDIAEEDNARVAVFEEVTAEVPKDGNITDPAFLLEITQSSKFQRWLGEQTEPFTVATRFAQPFETIGVPPGAVLTVTDVLGCVVSDGQTVSVSIVNSELGTVFVIPKIPVATVTVPAVETGLQCG
ncbi:peptidoglycan-binding domain-containing protein [Jonesiaceae bacterium BS-20]|uniref:Peptidoglycan-binding domain-containing protein n=1 Tax=Jonesiaceae bacterium BS-20 TaxID=3120821 RepID=A0AAU7E047_9MICO